MKKLLHIVVFISMFIPLFVEAREIGREYVNIECRGGLVYMVKYHCWSHNASGTECTKWDVIDMKQVYSPGPSSLTKQDSPQPKACK
jgi:hypothetical protein